MVPNDIYLMGFHPWDEEEDEPVEFLDTGDWKPDNEFMMVLIQKYDELKKLVTIYERLDIISTGLQTTMRVQF